MREHPAFKKPQKAIFEKKQGRSAKCPASIKEINVGDIVLRMGNFLVVPYGSKKAAVNTIFSCAKPACTNWMPKCTNVRRVIEDNIATETKIGDEEKEDVMRQFRSWEYYYLVLQYFFCFEWRVMNVKRTKKSYYLVYFTFYSYILPFLLWLNLFCNIWFPYTKCV